MARSIDSNIEGIPGDAAVRTRPRAAPPTSTRDTRNWLATDSVLRRLRAGWQWLTGVSLAARAPQATVPGAMSAP
jgi:hypothetical protein